MGSDNTIEDASQDEDSKNVLSLAQAPQGSDQSSELQQGLSLPDMHALEQPSQSGSSAVPCLNTRGFNSYAGTSLQDAASQDEENSAVSGDSYSDVFYDAVSLLAPLTAASQDFWDNLETEPNSDNPFDDAASSFVITACDSEESDIFFACHMGTEPTARQVFAAKATRPVLAATSAAAEAVLHARWAALHAGLLPKGAYLAPGHPKHPDAGFNSRDGISFRDAASHDAESSAVGGDSDCDVFYDAVSLLAPWTPEAQDFWANPDTEASSDNPWDNAASTAYPPTTKVDSSTNNKFFSLRSHLRSKRSARQKPSLMKWAKRSLKRLKSTGVRISSGIQRCTAVPKVKDCGAEEYIHTPKQKVMTAAEALILVTC
ncbi:g10984 [Coccomyxa viridis]|uniref:G10984 protein n=1 Tax=Coccomyxa viridis TaxID=1274662 RepID=A0ABP1G745_9CHLO